MIEIVFFDAGETLLHPHPSFAELFARIGREAGYDIHARDVHRIQEEMAPYLIDQDDETAPAYTSLDPTASKAFWLHLYTRFLEELDIKDEALADRLYERFSHTSSYKLFEDALPVLHRLQGEGYRLGLISNFERFLEEMLVELEVGHLFDVTVISGIEGYEKPDPNIYRVALERASVEPRYAVHVGDSPVLDVEPATEVGMNAVLLDRVGRVEQHPGLRIASLKELPEVVSNL